MSDVGVFSDLDRTLIYSAAALDLTVPDEAAPRLLCVELYQRAPLSYVTERAAVGIAALNEARALVPVTTRTPAQYRRVHLPGPEPAYALTANGGRLLRDGVEDEDWSTALASRLEGSGAAFAEVYAALRDRSEQAPWVRTVREAEGLFCYAVVERATMPAAWLEELTGWCTDHGWTVSVQGRKIYCVPVGLSKAAAIREVALMLGVSTALAAGDSLLDTGGKAVRPAHGELHETAYARPGLTVTTATGVAAGEEIVDWMLAHAL